MKRSLFCALVLGFVIALSGTACKHNPKGLTPINGPKPVITAPPSTPVNPPPLIGRQGQMPGENDNINGKQLVNPPDLDTNLTKGAGGIPQGDLKNFDGRPVDKTVFTAYTVYFDFDRSAVRESEKSKLEAVADYMKKATPDKDLLIEGYCDERGTEEYNRSLGERRALALREYLVNLGYPASKIRTVSYGKDNPADPEHNEAAWAKNRRGEFGVMLPKP